MRTSATCWSAFSSDAPWHDCHLHCWASLPYWVLSAPELRAAALALALPLYHRVLESGDTLVCASGTQTYLKRVQAILCPADVKRTAPRRVVLQGCKKCGRIMPAIELTVGGLCYKCGYVRQVAPGIWEDSEEGLHFDIPALLKLFDLPDTPENRLLAAREVDQVVQRQVPNSLIHLRTDVSPAN